MTTLVNDTSKFVSNLLEEKLPSSCLYHNLMHTMRVFKSTKEIIDNTPLSDEEEEILLLSALLHDTGYIEGKENHEERSAQIAASFLTDQNADNVLIEAVKKCIMATKMTATPETKLDEIIRDADASHFAKDYFEEASEFLRQELQLQNIADFDKETWRDGNIKLFKKEHSYYTQYAQEHWNPMKEQNLQIMIEEQGMSKKERKAAKEIEKVKLKMADPEKAIQSVFRVTLKNHIKLSDIADTKANILLSVNAIIISIALSNLIPKLDNPSNAYLIIPTMIFLLFTITAIIMSVLATRPNVTSGKFSKEDVDNKKVNLLFFGNFHKMSLSEYEWAMNEMLNDKEYIYSAMTKDLYFLGLVLNKKYKILRWTYSIFMIGIIVSVIAFAISFKVSGN